MAIQVKHKFVSAKVDTLDNSKIQPSNWNDTHDLLLAGGVVVGRAAGVGQAAATELPMGAMGQTLIATADAAAARAAIVADATGTTISGAANKVTPVDGDSLAVIDSAAGNALKRTTWAQIKATLKTYFDTLYIAVGGTVTALQNFVSSTGAVVLAPTGAGTVYLRPNGSGSGAGQTYIDSAGTLHTNGSIIADGTFYRGGTPIPFTLGFESAQQVINSGGQLVIPHGLGSKPKLYLAVIINIAGELGYSVGDELLVDPGLHDGATGRGLSIVPDAANMVIRFGSGGLQINNKGTGGSSAINNGNWRFVVRAWA